MAGRVTYFFSPISAALPLVCDGKLRALAASTARRSSVLPTGPTIAEAGLPGFDYSLWVGMLVESEIVQSAKVIKAARIQAQ
jgi:tripartite-type tricarboxylate transporter receptor subunit TctC